MSPAPSPLPPDLDDYLILAFDSTIAILLYREMKRYANESTPEMNDVLKAIKNYAGLDVAYS